MIGLAAGTAGEEERGGGGVGMEREPGSRAGRRGNEGAGVVHAVLLIMALLAMLANDKNVGVDGLW